MPTWLEQKMQEEAFSQAFLREEQWSRVTNQLSQICLERHATLSLLARETNREIEAIRALFSGASYDLAALADVCRVLGFNLEVYFEMKEAP